MFFTLVPNAIVNGRLAVEMAGQWHIESKICQRKIDRLVPDFGWNESSHATLNLPSSHR